MTYREVAVIDRWLLYKVKQHSWKSEKWLLQRGLIYGKMVLWEIRSGCYREVAVTERFNICKMVLCEISKVAVTGRWLLQRGLIYGKMVLWEIRKVAIIGRWLWLRSGCCWETTGNSSSTVLWKNVLLPGEAKLFQNICFPGKCTYVHVPLTIKC